MTYTAELIAIMKVMQVIFYTLIIFSA